MKRYRTFYVFLFLVVLLFLLLGLIQLVGFVWISSSGDDAHWEPAIELRSIHSGLTRSVVVPVGSPPARESQHNCTYHSCFDVYRCGYTSVDGPPQISVYVYPPTRYVDEAGAAHELPISHEFADMLQAIVDSGFYTPDASAACLLVPSIDLLNQNTVRLHVASQILATLHRLFSTHLTCLNCTGHFKNIHLHCCKHKTVKLRLTLTLTLTLTDTGGAVLTLMLGYRRLRNYKLKCKIQI